MFSFVHPPYSVFQVFWAANCQIHEALVEVLGETKAESKFFDKVNISPDVSACLQLTRYPDDFLGELDAEFFQTSWFELYMRCNDR